MLVVGSLDVDGSPVWHRKKGSHLRFSRVTSDAITTTTPKFNSSSGVTQNKSISLMQKASTDEGHVNTTSFDTVKQNLEELRAETNNSWKKLPDLTDDKSTSQWNQMVKEHDEKLSQLLARYAKHPTTTVHHRSVCPWTETIDRQENRIPITLRQVRCLNETERAEHHRKHNHLYHNFQCAPIYMNFLARIRNDTAATHETSRNAREHLKWSWKEMTITVGCTLVHPVVVLHPREHFRILGAPVPPTVS